MNDPGSYEVINPSDFGVERHVQIAHRLTGWNALYNRAQKLSLDITEDQIKAATSMIKNLADERGVTMNHVDSILIKLATGPKVSSCFSLSLSLNRSFVSRLRRCL
jgi:homocitrate synthase